MENAIIRHAGADIIKGVPISVDDFIKIRIQWFGFHDIPFATRCCNGEIRKTLMGLDCGKDAPPFIDSTAHLFQNRDGTVNCEKFIFCN